MIYSPQGSVASKLNTYCKQLAHTSIGHLKEIDQHSAIYIFLKHMFYIPLQLYEVC